jgi:polar amino acid transport system substrate-binding protein
MHEGKGNRLRENVRAKLILLLLVVIGLGVVSLGIGYWLGREEEKDHTWAVIQQTGVLRVGMDASYPPFEEIDETTGELRGYDVELAREIGRRLDLEVQFVNIGFDGLYDALIAKKVDAVISALPYDPLRTQDVFYTVSYFNAGLVLVVGEDEAEIESVDDLSGRTLGVEWGSESDAQGRRLVKRLDGLTLHSYPTPLDTLWGLKNGEVEAVLVDAVSAHHFIKHEGAVKIVGEPMTDESYVIAVGPTSTELLSVLNAVLLTLRDDGTLIRLRDKWF